MGTQLSITKEVMENAGWTSEEIVVREGYMDYYPLQSEGLEPEWVKAVVERKWSHPEKGVIRTYAVSSGDFFIDCNSWGTNRALCESLGLLDLPGYLG